jgi:hypothetical protein
LNSLISSLSNLLLISELLYHQYFKFIFKKTQITLKKARQMRKKMTFILQKYFKIQNIWLFGYLVFLLKIKIKNFFLFKFILFLFDL